MTMALANTPDTPVAKAKGHKLSVNDKNMTGDAAPVAVTSMNHLRPLRSERAPTKGEKRKARMPLAPTLTPITEKASSPKNEFCSSGSTAIGSAPLKNSKKMTGSA
mgnify:CR=1 FL=1